MNDHGLSDGGSVAWLTAQQCSRTQRAGRYTPESMAHPAKMLPSIAAAAISAYTRVGDLVIDPMCGIGTTLIEAIQQGRDALGIEYEPRWAALAQANVEQAVVHGATGHGEVITGDARHLTDLLDRDRGGPVALVLTSPPYGRWVHGHLLATRDSHQPGICKRNHYYSRTRENLAHQRLDILLEAFTRILSGCRTLLAPGGVVAVTVRPIRIHGHLIDLPARITGVGQQAGLIPIDRIACLLCGLRDGQTVPRGSFFQMHEIRRARARGLPLHVISHEDLVIFRQPSESTCATPHFPEAGNERNGTHLYLRPNAGNPVPPDNHE